MTAAVAAVPLGLATSKGEVEDESIREEFSECFCRRRKRISVLERESVEREEEEDEEEEAGIFD